MKKQFRFIYFGFLFILFINFPLSLKAYEFKLSGYDADWSLEYNACDGTVEVKFLYYFDDSNDDWIDNIHIDVQDHTGAWIEFFRFEDNHFSGAQYEFNNPSSQNSDFWWSQIGNNHMDFYDKGNIGNSKYQVSAKLYALPSLVLGAQMHFRIRGKWQEGGGVDQNFGNDIILGIQTQSITEPQSMMASTNNCNSVKIQWLNPTTLPCGTSDHSKWKVFIDRKLPSEDATHWINIGETKESEFTDNTVLDGVSYDYRTVALFEPNSDLDNWSAHSITVTGNSKQIPDIPSNFSLSQVCENQIRLDWVNNVTIPGNPGFADELVIVRYTNALPHTIIIPNQNFYIDEGPLQANATIGYNIKSKNGCGDVSAPTTIKTIMTLGKPKAAANLSVQTTPSAKKLNLNWTDKANNEQGYIIKRTLSTNNSFEIFKSPTNTFTDSTLRSCDNYKYEVMPYNSCSPDGDIDSAISITTYLEPDFSNTFNSTNFVASKGYFQNEVQLTWSYASADNIQQIRIYRKIYADTASSYVLLNTLNAGTGVYHDETADAGILYLYKIQGESNCGNDLVLTNTIETVGFRSKTATITGQVNYAGNIAVEGVKILAESTNGSTGKSLHLNDAYLKIENQNTITLSNELTFEGFVRPGTNAYNADFTLLERPNAFKFYYNGSINQYVFRVKTNSNILDSIKFSNSIIPVENYTQITAKVKDKIFQIFINGDSIISKSVGTGFGLSINLDNDSSIIIGSKYKGELDEIRIWNKAKTDEQIKQDYSRFVDPGEQSLIVYLKMDEGIGNYAYDASHSGVNFNKHHAEIINADFTWSNNIPSSGQLSYSSYTNDHGNYIMTISYSGTGEVFVFNPSYLAHQFSPATKALFIGEGATVHNDINFIDKSSFRVQGSVIFNNSSCGVADVLVKLDGNALISGNGQAKTDPLGNFDIQVPVGEHFLEFEKSGHVFSVGRFPASGTYNFQSPLSGLLMKDSTLVKVIGKVVGGNREKSKPFGFGLTKNNIGVSRIEFKSQLGNGCVTDTAFTDSLTGEYTIFLPPLKYVPTVKVINNPTIAFGSTVLDFTTSPTIYKEYKTVRDFLGQTYYIDSLEYNHKIDYIYKVDPKIYVFDTDGESALYGDSSYTFIDPIMHDTTIYNLKTNPFRWPIFTQKDLDHKYSVMIKIFEEYQNYDFPNPKKDSVPTTSGLLRIDNEMVIEPHAEIQLENAMLNIDTLKSIVYQFNTGYPNFLENNSIPEYSFTKKLEINLDLPGNKIISWLPIPSNLVPPGGDKIYRAYLLGTQANGDQFVIEGPQVVDYVLRDPPGTSSSATRSVGSTESKSVSWSYNLGGSINAKDDIYVGTKFLSGIGVALETEIKNNISAGFKIELSGGNGGSISTDRTLTNEWSTYSGKDISPSASSDLFIGESKNMQFGLAEELAIIPDTFCNKGNCIGASNAQPGQGTKFAKKYGLSVIPDGYNTHFMVNQFDIENFIIPDLKKLRNIMMQTNMNYVSHLNVNDPNYAKNNDDPVFGSLVSTNTPDQEEFDDLTGHSYTLSNVDSTAADSVRLLNKQIKLWEDAIALNEWEKVNINNQDVIDSLKNKELDLLDSTYQQVNDAVYHLIRVNGTFGGLNALASVVPIPGGAFLRYATFAITTGTSIALNELMEEYETYLAKKARIERRYSGLGEVTNYTLTGGNSLKSTNTQTISTNFTRKTEYNISANLKTAVSGKVSGNGAGFEKTFEMNYKNSNSWSRDRKETETVTFALNDPNIGDLYSVDVYPSLLGWGPIFKTKAGGKTSCPHEDKIVTKYYQPGTTISERTLQVEKPSISVSPSKQTNIPTTEAAVFNLTLGNLSEAGYTNSYQVTVAQHTNPFGAVIGGTVGTTLTIPGGTSLNRVLTVSKGPGPVYNYDSILVLISSTCQYAAGAGFIKDIVDSVYISAHFLPTCSAIKFSSPDEKWVVNNSNNNILPLALSGYNINFDALEQLKIDYKPTANSNWIGLKNFYKTPPDTTFSAIPTSVPFALYNWNVSDLPDGSYDLRASTKCQLASLINPLIYTGVIDRINPHAFGAPSPADGVLSPNDEISIKFNEPIDLGSINAASNFDIRGVLNESIIDHSTSINFNGSNSFAQIVGGLGLNVRDFTIEFSIKRNAINTEQAILSQGKDSLDQLYIGFNAANKLVFRIGDLTVTSTKTFNDLLWHNIAISYNKSNETLEMFLIDQNTTASLINNGSTSFTKKYEGQNTDCLLGKKSNSNSAFLSGNIHELRVWSTPRTLSQFSLTNGKRLNGNENGLVYVWSMDEATGNSTMDHSRGREMILSNSNWQILPSGNAADFLKINKAHIKVATNDVAISEESDMTIEFWFKSNQVGNAVLFSNGSGQNILADSNRSWVISKEDSLIKITHKGLVFTATNTNYFNNIWHHFAMVLNRSSELFVYIDGVLENSVDAITYHEFASDSITLGARRYYNGSTSKLDSFYSGQIDEFRLWSLARTYDQIKRDKQNRMMGDEPGLELYLPFESYSVDPSGIKILSPTFNNQSIHNHPVSNALSTLVFTTPAIKIQRPIEAISFNYSVNNDQIIFTPTSPTELIENVTLDVTVKGIKDLRGNSMQNPKTWNAYVDKNQVVWQDQLLKYEIKKGSPLTFKTNIFNKGGASQKFNITDLPVWLKASVRNGIIAPNSSIEVIFTLDQGINIGNYSVGIGLISDFNYSEKLNVELNVKGLEPDWRVNDSLYDNTMNIIGTIKINGAFSSDVNDMISAYVGAEPRGTARVEYVAGLDVYRFFMTIYGNPGDGLVSFKIWDASTGKTYTSVFTNPAITFTTNLLVGSMSAPQIFDAGTIVSYDIPIVKGYNWLTYFLDHANPNNLGDVLLSVAEKDALIKNNTSFSTFNGTNWVGSVSLISPTGLYKFSAPRKDTLVLKGTIVDPTSRIITLVNGWNWLGFISVRNQNVTLALSNLIPTVGDIIKSKTAFATYNGASSGWVGNLKTMVAGEGYMYKNLGSTKTFTYPLAGKFDNIAGTEVRTILDSSLVIDNGSYQNNMTMIIRLNSSCFEKIQDLRLGIGIADKDGHWRGISKLDMLDNNIYYFMTIAGNQTEELDLYLINFEGKNNFDLKQKILFEPNKHIGELNNPYDLFIQDETCNQIVLSNQESESAYFEVYPNIVDNFVNIMYHGLTVSNNVLICMYDNYGKKVLSESLKDVDINNLQRIRIKTDDLTAGVYFIQLQNGLTNYTRIIEKK